MKKNIKYLIIFTIITVIIILSYSYKIYAATTPCKHTTKYDTVVQEPTCTQEGWVHTRCAKCGALVNQYPIGRNPNNHTGEVTEIMVEKATCSTLEKWKNVYSCCNYEETYEKDKIDDENHTTNDKSFYDYSNHINKTPTGNVEYKYIEEDGKIYYATFTEYECKEIKNQDTQEETGCGRIWTEITSKVEATNYSNQPPEEIYTGGGWDYTAHTYWKHSDTKWNSGKLEFLCQRYSNKSISNSITDDRKGITVKDISDLLLCKWKHGSIRFTPNVQEFTKILTGWINPHAAGSALADAKAYAERTIVNLITPADYWKPTENVTEDIYVNYRGYNYVVEDRKYGWIGDTFYGKRYCTTPIWTAEASVTRNNDIQAYILSSGSEFSPVSNNIGFKAGNYHSTVSEEADDQLIQDALWKDVGGFNEGGAYSSTSTKPADLLQEAKDYEKYHATIQSGYEELINNSEINKKRNENAKVIVNREKGYYIVGPFQIEYPDDHRFSYIEDMYLLTKKEDGTVSNEIREFDIIKVTDNEEPVVIKVNNSNQNEYVNSKEEFFIRFDAEKTGNPTAVECKVTFAYLDNCSAGYITYVGKGKIRQVCGDLIKEDSTTKYIPHYSTNHDGDYTNPDGTINHDKDYDYISSKCYYYRYKTKIYTKEVGYYTAQKFAMLKERQRTWKKYTISVTDNYMDLTMNLGGFVWEDTKGGKETENDNIYDTSKSINGQIDRPIPGITVTLYRKDGTMAQLTKDNNPNNDSEEQIQNPTVTDSDGKYKFTGINSIYQYYVQFTYNAQYYEPVEYVSPIDNNNGWKIYEENKIGTWTINSNGTDVQKEREGINARFASIGSSPENYQGATGYNETFTKMQLMGYTLQEDGKYRKTREAVIDSHLVCSNSESNHEHTGQCYDTFGNLIIQTSNDETTKKMIQYVKDCQLNSYTGIDKIRENVIERNEDLYPIEPIFEIGNIEVLHNDVIRKLIRNEDDKLIDYTKVTIQLLYKNDANLYINQGYTQRRTADLALHKDIDNIHVKINGKQQTYVYDTRTKDDNVSVSNSDGTKKGDTTWDMNIRLADGYYNAQYSREFYQSDYEYKIDDYNGKADAYRKTQDDELKVYITYKLTIKNQAQSVRARIDEIIDYYDEDLVFDTSDEYIINNSYMKTRMDGKTYTYGIKASDKSRYNNTTMTQIDGYDNLYVQLDGDVYMKTGQTEFVYLTFRVKKDGNRNVLLDEKEWKLDGNSNIISTPIGVGKENIAEINGYSTIYGDGTTVPNVGDVSGKPAGIVDRDSNPGNIKATDVPKDGKVNYNNLEDDTDKSPNVRLKLATTQDENNRLLDGIVWEDLRTVTNDMQYTKVANGIMNNGETGINGVTVQLVELMENGTEYIWKQFSTGQGSYEPIINKLGLATTVNDNTVGKYAFKSYPAGNYIVRFIYGDTIKTVLPNSQTDITKLVGAAGENAKSYTGQDYKSTSYQVGIPNGKAFTFRKAQILSNDVTKYTSNESGKFYYDVTASDTNANVSDAKDIMKDDIANVENGRQNATLNSREDVENYSKSNVTNHIAEVLASQEQLQEYYKNDKDNKDKVNSLLYELMTKTAMTAETGVINTEIEKDTQTTTNQTVNNVITYKVQNVNLGLEERPKAQLAINKEVTNVKLTLADGSTLFDAKQSATNVLWKDHKKYDLGYTKYNYVLDTNKYGSIENIRNKNATDVRFGLIQLSMDEELMHGATIKISYKVTVSNVGEVDYDDDMFYYTGTASDVSKVVETQANQVIDYVANNLQFDGSDVDNNAWKVISRNDLINNGLVNSKLENEVEKYNTIITTKSDDNSNIAKTSLQPEIYNKDKSEVSDKLVLTQLITSENSTDDLTYKNIVEIVKTSNTVGRRNQYSVVGNQNPIQKPQELDSDISEAVRILPPFGANITYIIIAIVTMVSAIVVVGGIIFIKKKVLK